jgi:polyisoprenoid-binding protein YceI
MSTTAPRARGLSTGAWTLDPARSSVEFHVRHFYGLVTVKGHFDSYRGTLDLSATPAVELVIDADSLDTNNQQRDKHLRSADFFDVANHPQVRFAADDVTLDGDKMSAHGRLYAAGKDIALDASAAIEPAADGFEIVATALADHRELGMTWSPLGILRAPSKLIVRGHLIPAEAAR